MESYDVIVVGAGPTGMLLAGDTAAVGFRVAVFEKHSQINKFSRAFGITPRTLEILAARGISEAIVTQGHWLWSDREDTIFHRNTNAFHSQYPGILAIPQPLVDAEIERYALQSGAQIFRGKEVTQVTAEHNSLRVEVRDTAGSEPHTYTARFVVAADGAKSTVRRTLGIDFPGKTVFSACALADVILDPASVTSEMMHSPLVARSDDACIFIMPYGQDNKFRMAAWNRNYIGDESAPVDPQEMKDLLHICLGREVQITEIMSTSRFSSDERQIASYQHGKVFFIGDAAHCHSPAGGQGLNTGLQDAANLSWKLTLILSGAPESIAHTYHRERHPIGRKAIKSSGLLLRSNITKNMLWRAGFTLLRMIFSHSKRIQKIFAGTMTGLGLHYGHKNLAGDKHALIGTRAALETEDGSIFTLLNGRDFILVLNKELSATEQAQAHQIQQRYPLCRLSCRQDPGETLLIRPDGYIAAVGDTTWQRELAQWMPPAYESIVV